MVSRLGNKSGKRPISIITGQFSRWARISIARKSKALHKKKHEKEYCDRCTAEVSIKQFKRLVENLISNSL